MVVGNVALALVGLVALFFGGDALVRGASRLAAAFGMSPVFVGLTVVAFGTSFPELLVSVNAATQGVSDIALGNVLGSNLANIGLILGLTALIYPIRIEWRLLRREIPIMIAVSAAVFLLALDGELSALDGFLLGLGFVAFVLYAYMLARTDRRQIAPEIEEYDRLEGITPVAQTNRPLEVGRLVVGILLLGVGAQWTVDGSAAIARSLGVSEFVIGVTLVAVGTSLPELASSLVAALRKENDIVVGNVIGSNVVNILLILGVTGLVRPVPVPPAQLAFEFPVMLAFSVALVPFLRNRVLERWEGAACLTAYALVIVLMVTR